MAGLNLDDFIVRQHRRVVEKYARPEAWIAIDDEKRKELVDEIAPLFPSIASNGIDSALSISRPGDGLRKTLEIKEANGVL